MIVYLTRCRKFTLAMVAGLALLMVIAPSNLQLAVEFNTQPLNEESHDDRGEEVQEARRIGTPPAPRVPERRPHRTRVAPHVAWQPARVISVAPPLHPSQFSVRRLI